MSAATLTTTLLFTQFVLLLIVFFGILVLRTGEQRFTSFSAEVYPITGTLSAWVFGFTMVTFACLVFSQDFVLLSQPMFGDIRVPAWSRESAFLAVFVLDILGAGLFVAATGGAKDSPFAAVLFTLPALSIFLRETPLRLGIYTGLVAMLFLVFSKPYDSRHPVLVNINYILAFRLVTLCCLALTSLVGYVTRPA